MRRSLIVRVLGGVLLFGALTGAARGAAVDGLLKGLSVGAPVEYENLTVFPLTGRATGSTGYLTLDKAIRDGDVEVEEKDGGDVNTVRIRNRSDRYVFGMAGEIITGAKQTRMLERDVVLPPKSGWLDLSVYCVEHGRWSDASEQFSSKGQIVTGALRGTANQTQSQSEVWAEVSRNNAALDIAAPTDRFDAVFEDATVQEQLARYRGNLEEQVPRLAPNVLGVAVASGDRIVCVDVFASPALFKKMWSRLLESYVIDAVARQPKGAVDAADVRGLLSDAAGAETVLQAGIGEGQLYRLEADGVTGSALVRGSEVVHLDLFPEVEAESSPLRLDIRRQGTER